MSRKSTSAPTLDGKLLHCKKDLGKFDDMKSFQIFISEALPSMNILLAAKHKRKAHVLQYLVFLKNRMENAEF